jgi:hypothetical protein
MYGKMTLLDRVTAMYPVHTPNPKVMAAITALPWLMIWIAALVTLQQDRFSDVPFERLLAWTLAVGSPLLAWKQFRGYWA